MLGRGQWCRLELLIQGTHGCTSRWYWYWATCKSIELLIDISIENIWLPGLLYLSDFFFLADLISISGQYALDQPIFFFFFMSLFLLLLYFLLLSFSTSSFSSFFFHPLSIWFDSTDVLYLQCAVYWPKKFDNDKLLFSLSLSLFLSLSIYRSLLSIYRHQ